MFLLKIIIEVASEIITLYYKPHCNQVINIYLYDAMYLKGAPSADETVE